MRHGVRRSGDGGVEVRLTVRERELLRGLPAQLAPVVSGERDVAGARGRLYPRAYDDPVADAEYQELMATDLAKSRTQALETFAQTLQGGRSGRLIWSRRLDSEQAHAWLSALNDARLVLAMVVGVTSEDRWQTGPDPADPVAVALWYLGWLQEELLEALTGHL